MNVDFIVVGQGVCGTFLSYYLLEKGFSVIVVDQFRENTASQIASGVINPVTGRRIVKTWMIDELMPFCWDAYFEIGNKLGKKYIQNVKVLDFHPAQQMHDAFQKRLQEENVDYLSEEDTANWQNKFSFEYGIGAVSPAHWINLRELLHDWRQFLMSKNILLENEFSNEDLALALDGIVYQNIHAKKIVFCDGVGNANKQFFPNLPFAPNKGEAILAKVPDLPAEFIYKKGLSIVPWSPENHLFWIGSTYNWQFENDEPSEAFRQKVEETLTNWLKLPFEIVDHLSSIRPANTERRPFVGWNANTPQIGILNGMGTKGCSLAPYFAKQLVENFTDQTPINELADVSRFFK
ncbi:NAD(P)/FAD-dependent oxidoreductase [Rhizosphaericola mali]|uniref:FAD-binding oxidoreductase n=1 Tax=Rhizosphaericola mali TaxID=2545455 RepID=A0A5P2G1N3_9BACT|nr:FAD-binding oxidoreductase [Rhizosphaericola mali]QES87750.1 FAD-binding oxidoreductase [Rhizosphaericola mali]